MAALAVELLKRLPLAIMCGSFRRDNRRNSLLFARDTCRRRAIMAVDPQLEIQCPNGHRLQAPRGLAGRDARCTVCQEVFVIPGDSDGASGDLAASGAVEPPPVQQSPLPQFVVLQSAENPSRRELPTTAAEPLDARGSPPAAATERMNLRPATPRVEDLATTLEDARDELLEALRRACEEAGIEADLRKSPPGSGTVWVHLETSFRDFQADRQTDRSALTFTITAYPFHQSEFVLTLRVTDGLRTRVLQGVAWPDAREIRRLVQHAARAPRFRWRSLGVLPRSPVRHVRLHWWQLWRRRNRSRYVRRTWSAWLATCLTVGGVLSLPLQGIGLLPLAVAVLLAIRERWREAGILGGERPAALPRLLRLRASGSQLLSEGSECAAAVAEGLRERLDRAADETPLVVDYEQVVSTAVDNAPEREQISIALGRGLVLVRIRRCGDDLLVSWESYLNRGAWKERVLTSGIATLGQQYVHVVTLEAEEVGPTALDHADAHQVQQWGQATVARFLRRFAESRGLPAPHEGPLIQERTEGETIEWGKPPVAFRGR